MGLMWELEPHVCKACFGRIVSRKIGDVDDKLYQCSNCGAEAEGSGPSVLCACGVCLPRKGGSPIKLGLKCQQNTERGTDFPSLYIATLGQEVS